MPSHCPAGLGINHPKDEFGSIKIPKLVAVADAPRKPNRKAIAFPWFSLVSDIHGSPGWEPTEHTVFPLKQDIPNVTFSNNCITASVSFLLIHSVEIVGYNQVGKGKYVHRGNVAVVFGTNDILHNDVSVLIDMQRAVLNGIRAFIQPYVGSDGKASLGSHFLQRRLSGFLLDPNGLPRVSISGVYAVLYGDGGIVHVLFNPVGAVRKIVGGLGNIVGSLGLSVGIAHQLVGLRPASNHLVKLASEYEASHNSDNYASHCETDHRPLESGHSFLYPYFGLLELLGGCWLCWTAVPRLGYGGRSLALGCICLAVGMISAIHGGFLLLLKFVLL
jgi:hypothetical protein